MPFNVVWSKGKKNADYQTEMDGECFFKWCKENVFPSLAAQCEKCVLVLDRATYHTMLTEDTKPPTTKCEKAMLVDPIGRDGRGPHLT